PAHAIRPCCFVTSLVPVDAVERNALSAHDEGHTFVPSRSRWSLISKTMEPRALDLPHSCSGVLCSSGRTHQRSWSMQSKPGWAGRQGSYTISGESLNERVANDRPRPVGVADRAHRGA